ncbi:DNA repair protein RAD57 [Zymoseptoria brevis]|uniref:DNA repair protein RAD57 n=1 Tax=Zymoseptoria brevis TaxID=1047168 RepID=A0A0F4G807_9PEZI|nr:DNA repair protein RAD57 [Zymoseptoria brevis]
MSNLLTLLSSSFDTTPYTHILPSLERHLISTADLLTLDPVDVAKRAQVPPGEVKKLVDAVVEALHGDVSVKASDSNVTGWNGLQHAGDVAKRWQTISTLDDALDEALNGGIACGHLTEIVGESAAGKTQLLLTLLLSAQLSPSPSPSTPSLPPPSSSSLYISTEAPLQTTRLTQILTTHPHLSSLPSSSKPTLSHIHSTHIHDLEAQDHILRYQVPVAIRQHNVRLLVIDSVAANFRAESLTANDGQRKGGVGNLAKRSAQLAQMGALLRDLARETGVAVVVANQVADRFSAADNGRLNSSLRAPTQSSTQDSSHRANSPSGRAQQQHHRQPDPKPPPKRQVGLFSTTDPLSLDHQQNFFTGWGDEESQTNLKTPSLGLTWTNQLSTRIAWIKIPIYDYQNGRGEEGDGREVNVKWARRVKVVFSGWAPAAGESGEGGGKGVEVEIWKGGVRSLRSKQRMARDAAVVEE